MDTIKLNGSAYPFRRTSEGGRLMLRLNVDFRAAVKRKPIEVQKFAYCIAAGAAITDAVDFDFTIDQFIAACPHSWKQLVEAMLLPAHNDESLLDDNYSDTAPAAQVDEAPETAEDAKEEKKIKKSNKEQ